MSEDEDTPTLLPGDKSPEGTSAGEDIEVELLLGLPRLPLKLLRSHDRGELLFFAGAGVSRGSRLPDFAELTGIIYEQIGETWFKQRSLQPTLGLTAEMAAEVKAHVQKEYDLQLTMMESRIDGERKSAGQIRKALRKALLRVPVENSKSGKTKPARPSRNHESLMRLAHRGGENVAILTTNFDTLFEGTVVGRLLPAEQQRIGLNTLPRPDWNEDLLGIMHVHGVIWKDGERPTPIILNSLDFADYYVRRRVVPDFLLDVARRNDIVFVGYSVGDVQVRGVLGAMKLDNSARSVRRTMAILLSRDPSNSSPAGEVVDDVEWTARGIDMVVRYDLTTERTHTALEHLLAAWADWSLHNVVKVSTTPSWRSAHLRLVGLLNLRFTNKSPPNDDRQLAAWLVKRETSSKDKAREQSVLDILETARPDPGWIAYLVDAIAATTPETTKQEIGRSASDADRIAFLLLRPRLTDRTVLNWFVDNGRERSSERETIRRLLVFDDTRPASPWDEAWRLLLDHFEAPKRSDRDLDAYRLARELGEHPLTAENAARLLVHVEPTLRIEDTSAFVIYDQDAVSKPPERIGDLFWVRFDGARVETARQFARFDGVERAVLRQIVDGLEGFLRNVLSIKRRVDGPGKDGRVRLILLRAVAFRPDTDGDIDQYLGAEATVVKLLDAAAKALARIDPKAGAGIANGWLSRSSEDNVHLRLWASLARESKEAVPPAALEQGLANLDDQEFWSINGYPEIAQLRRDRFLELGPAARRAMIARIKALEPDGRAGHPGEDRDLWVLYDAARELERLARIAPHELDAGDRAWIESALARLEARGGDLKLAALALRGQSEPLYEGYTPATTSGWVAADVDNSFDGLSGEQRLNTLEEKLGDGDYWRTTTPASGAYEWLARTPLDVILRDLATYNAPRPRLWEAIGNVRADLRWQASTERKPDGFDDDGAMALAARQESAVLESTVRGLSRWVQRHADLAKLEVGPGFHALWSALFPFAAVKPLDNADDKLTPDERLERWASNQPLGDLTLAFLRTCPAAAAFPNDDQRIARLMLIKDTLSFDLADGHRAILCWWLVREIGYFQLVADDLVEEWILPELRNRGRISADISIGLWGAFRAPSVFPRLLDETFAAILDVRLSQDARRDLLNLVVFADFRARTEPPRDGPGVDREARTQAALRAIPNDMRADIARQLAEFIREGAIWFMGKGAARNPSGETEELGIRAYLFRQGIKPFIERCWPRDFSLITPGVSRGFARLPAMSGAAFAEAVDAIAWALKPFDAGMSMDFGFREHGGGTDDEGRFASLGKVVATATDARALLRLLDDTIAEGREGIVYGLAELLDQIVAVDPALATDRGLTRLRARTRK